MGDTIANFLEGFDRNRVNDFLVFTESGFTLVPVRVKTRTIACLFGGVCYFSRVELSKTDVTFSLLATALYRTPLHLNIERVSIDGENQQIVNKFMAVSSTILDHQLQSMS